jgi:hypothetical protein
MKYAFYWCLITRSNKKYPIVLETAATSTLLFDNKLIELDDLCDNQGCSPKVEGKLVIAPHSEHIEKNMGIAQHLAKV